MQTPWREGRARRVACRGLWHGSQKCLECLGRLFWEVDRRGEVELEEEEGVERVREKAPDPERILSILGVLGEAPLRRLLAKAQAALGQAAIHAQLALRRLVALLQAATHASEARKSRKGLGSVPAPPRQTARFQ